MAPLAVRRGFAMYALLPAWVGAWAVAYMLARARFQRELPDARMAPGPSRRALASRCLLPVPWVAAALHLAGLLAGAQVLNWAAGGRASLFGLRDVAITDGGGVCVGYLVFCFAACLVATAAGAARVLALDSLDEGTPKEVTLWTGGAALVFAAGVAARALGRGEGGPAAGAVAGLVQRAGAAYRGVADWREREVESYEKRVLESRAGVAEGGEVRVGEPVTSGMPRAEQPGAQPPPTADQTAAKVGETIEGAAEVGMGIAAAADLGRGITGMFD